MKMNLTTKLKRGGTEVLAKLWHGNPEAVTYQNRTQAQKCVEKLGAEWCVFQSYQSRVFFVALENQFPQVAE